MDLTPQEMRQNVEALQQELAALPQYEPETRHYFHAGMYCREVFRHAGVIIVGKVHKKEHFYLIASGTVVITDGSDKSLEVTGPYLIESRPGAKRAVYAVTDAICMTFHITDAKTIEAAEEELVEDDPNATLTIGNKIKFKEIEVLP